MKKIIILLAILALTLCGCGKDAPAADASAIEAPTETAVLEVVPEPISNEIKVLRYVDALGVDLHDYRNARIFFNGKTYVFRGPGGYYDFKEMQDVGALRYDAAFPGEELVTDCQALDGFLVDHATGGYLEDTLRVSSDQYCEFLFIPEDAAFDTEERYVENEDGTLTLLHYYGKAEDFTVPAELNGQKVTAIGDNAFAFSPRLTSVTIPEGVTKIGHFAFSSCSRLMTVRFPATLKEVGYGLFQSSPLITELYFEGPAVASDRAERLFDGPVDGLELENAREWYPKGLNFKDINIYYHEDSGWSDADWAAFTKIPY